MKDPIESHPREEGHTRAFIYYRTLHPGEYNPLLYNVSYLTIVLPIAFYNQGWYGRGMKDLVAVVAIGIMVSVITFMPNFTMFILSLLLVWVVGLTIKLAYYVIMSWWRMEL